MTSTRTATPGRAVDASSSAEASTGAAPDAAELIAEALTALAAGDQDLAYQALVEVTARIERGVQIDPVDAFDATWLYVGVLLDRGEVQQAARVFADLSTWRIPTGYQTAMLAVIRGRLLAGLGHVGAAENCLIEAASQHSSPYSPARWPALLALAGAGTCAARLGRFGTAEQRLQQAYTRMVADFGHADPAVLETGVALAEVRVQCGATGHLRSLIDDLDSAAADTLGPRHPLHGRITALRTAVGPATADTAACHHAAPQSPPAEHAEQPLLGNQPAESTSAKPAIVLLLLLVTLTVAAVVGVAVAAVDWNATSGPHRTQTQQPSANTTIAASGMPRSQPNGDAAVFPPPTGVRLIHDSGSTVRLAWYEHSGGSRPAAVKAARHGAAPSIVATVQAARTQATVAGLDRHADYCFTVATLYGPTVAAWSGSVCAERASPSVSTPSTATAAAPASGR